MDIITARLHIRDLIEEDAAPMHQLRTEPQVYHFARQFGPETPERTHRWIDHTMVYNQRPGRDSHNCAIVLQATNQVIGWIGWGFEEKDQQQTGDVGIGYAILPQFWSQGFTTEALQGTLDFIFTTTATENAIAYCDIANIASARVMEKAGMRFLTNFFEPDDSSPDKVEFRRYIVNRVDWEKRAQS